MQRSVSVIGHSSLVLTVLVFLTLVLGPAGSAPARAQSLYLVEDSSDPVLSVLLQEGFLVSAREAGVSLVFADARLERVVGVLGVPFRQLDAEVQGWEYYLASGRPQRAPDGAFRQLARIGEASLLAVRDGAAANLLDLGFEVRRLFPRPIRLAPQKPRWAPAPSVASETAITGLVAAVSAESLESNVFWLESFGTRNAKKPGGREAANWLAARFRGFGIEQVEVRAWSPAYAGNVIATIPGKVEPNAIILLGGHFDSFAVESEYEPGADDNASGTSTLLEVARHLATQRLGTTVRFVAFSAEEWGLVGSEAYAATAAAQDENIVAMLNFDMLGHLSGRDVRDLDLIIDDYGRNEWLLQAAQDAAAAFVPDFSVIRGKLLQGRSDHESFWAHGYDAIFFFEDSKSPSPFIHTPEDILGLSYNDTTLHAQSTRVALALTATLAGLQGAVPVTLESFAAAPVGAGVRLQWSLFPAAQGAIAALDVERSAGAEGPWSVRTTTPLSPMAREFFDADAVSPLSLYYRLILERQDGGREATAPVQVRFGEASTRLEPLVELEPGGSFQVRYQLGVPVAQVHLGVYDVRGRLLRVLAAGPQVPGTYLLTWDGRDRRGETLVHGVYFVQLRAPDGNQARKVVLRR